MADSETAIRAERLTKLYGSDRGVLELDFSVAAGEVFGFLGPNGAGKTTTIRLILDLIRPTQGVSRSSAAIPRRDVAVRRRIGYLPGDLRLYERPDRTRALPLLRPSARPTRAGPGRGVRSAPRTPARAPDRSLSKGNRQKVGLVQAFMHEPDLLVLDEPTAGLDPLIQQTFYGIVREARQAGATVFLSSHFLPEVQHVADRVALIRDGRLALIAAVDELRPRAFARVEVSFAATPPAAAFAQIAGVREIERHGQTVLFALQGEADPLIKALARFGVVGIDSHEADLEDIFLNLYRSQEGAMLRNAFVKTPA